MSNRFFTCLFVLSCVSSVAIFADELPEDAKFEHFKGSDSGYRDFQKVMRGEGRSDQLSKASAYWMGKSKATLWNAEEVTLGASRSSAVNPSIWSDRIMRDLEKYTNEEIRKAGKSKLSVYYPARSTSFQRTAINSLLLDQIKNNQDVQKSLEKLPVGSQLMYVPRAEDLGRIQDIFTRYFQLSADEAKQFGVETGGSLILSEKPVYQSYDLKLKNAAANISGQVRFTKTATGGLLSYATAPFYTTTTTPNGYQVPQLVPAQNISVVIDESEEANLQAIDTYLKQNPSQGNILNLTIQNGRAVFALPTSQTEKVYMDDSKRLAVTTMTGLTHFYNDANEIPLEVKAMMRSVHFNDPAVLESFSKMYEPIQFQYPKIEDVNGDLDKATGRKHSMRLEDEALKILETVKPSRCRTVI